MGRDVTKVSIQAGREIEAHILGPVIKVFTKEIGKNPALSVASFYGVY
jgi:hypothetical protein